MASMPGTVTEPPASPSSGRCPPAGTRIPFAQLVAQTESFMACDVSTEVAFVASGNAMAVLPFDLEGLTVFQILPPGQTPSTSPLGGTVAYFAALSNASAGPIFALEPGTRLLLRGMMLFRRSGNAFTGGSIDTGTTARLFRVTRAARAPTAPSVPPPEAAAPAVATQSQAGTSASAIVPPTVPHVGFLAEGPGLGDARIELAARNALSNQDVALVDSRDVAAARAFVSTADILEVSRVAELRERLDADRLIVVQTRAVGRHGPQPIQVVVADRGASSPTTSFGQALPEAIEAEVDRLLRALPPMRRDSAVATSSPPPTRREPLATAPATATTPGPAAVATVSEGGGSNGASPTPRNAAAGSVPDTEATGAAPAAGTPSTAARRAWWIEVGTLLGYGSFFVTDRNAFSGAAGSGSSGTDVFGGGIALQLFGGFRFPVSPGGSQLLFLARFAFQDLANKSNGISGFSALAFGMGIRWYPDPARQGQVEPWAGAGLDFVSRFNESQGSGSASHISAVGLPLSVGVGYRLTNQFVLDASFMLSYWITTNACGTSRGVESCASTNLTNNTAWFLGLGARYDFGL